MNIMQKIWHSWMTGNVLPEYEAKVLAATDQIIENWQTYQAVGSRFGVPAYVIGALHYRESNANFKTHLANGDPLFDHEGKGLKTVHVPKGLGPFASWRESAVGAIEHFGGFRGYHWDLCNALDNCERYNGLGYRHMNLLSPYVWAGTNQYVGGLYVADGVFDPAKKDKRPGCAAIFLELKKRGYDLSERPQLVLA